MFERSNLKTKFISAVASAALVVGLVPLPAFAVIGNDGTDASGTGGPTPLVAGTFAEDGGLQGIGAQSSEPAQVNT